MKPLFYLVAACMLFAPETRAQQTVGLFMNAAGNENGYVLFAPIPSKITYLIDKCGRQVHSWTSSYRPGLSVYLLPDGSLLRTGNTANPTFTSGGSGGVIEKLDWNGNVTWAYILSDSSQCQHHDVCPMPNGHILVIAWEKKTGAEALAAGRTQALPGTTLWSEKILKLQPSGATTAAIVWEWQVWDHLVQEQDAAKANFAVVSQHPELIHLNYTGGPAGNADWLHMNSIAYNAALDQVLVSSHNFSEVWIIDHGTTTAQAAAHAGGRQNRGGDLLYRWGNPAAYNRGTAATRRLFVQHHAHWIDSGLTDAGKIMIFNNGTGRPAGDYSSVDVINPPVGVTGSYALSGSQAYGPDSATWTYKAPVPTDFYAGNISGAWRLGNGNTMICDGPAGNFFEINSNNQTVWRYINPVGNTILSQGSAAANNSAFRCTLYEPGYAGLKGRQLTPGNPIELNPLSYNCPATAGISSVTTGQEFPLAVGNPFREELMIRAAIRIPAASIRLTSATDESIGQWETGAINAGQTIRLSLAGYTAPGIYLLRIITPGDCHSFQLIHTF